MTSSNFDNIINNHRNQTVREFLSPLRFYISVKIGSIVFINLMGVINFDHRFHKMLLFDRFWNFYDFDDFCGSPSYFSDFQPKNEKNAKFREIPGSGWWTPFLRNMNFGKKFHGWQAEPENGNLAKNGKFWHFFSPPNFGNFSGRNRHFSSKSFKKWFLEYFGVLTPEP